MVELGNKKLKKMNKQTFEKQKTENILKFGLWSFEFAQLQLDCYSEH
jgi:hypothetical protein